jgi:hypothetical protein
MGDNLTQDLLEMHREKPGIGRMNREVQRNDERKRGSN